MYINHITHLGIGSNGSFAVFTGISKEILIALDAVGMLFTQDVTMTRQGHVTVEAAEMTTMPVLIHGFCVLARKYQLKHHKQSLLHTCTCTYNRAVNFVYLHVHV